MASAGKTPYRPPPFSAKPPQPRPMPPEGLFPNPGPSRVPFAQEDLARVFDVKTIQRGRTLVMAGAVRLGAAATRVEATVSDLGRELTVTVTPLDRGRRVAFERSCGCGRSACAHMAAAAMAALDARPEWRRTSLLDLMDQPVNAAVKSPSPPVGEGLGRGDCGSESRKGIFLPPFRA